MEAALAGQVVDFVSAICFIPRGIAKEKPEKVVLSQVELARIIRGDQECLESKVEQGDTDIVEIGLNDVSKVEVTSNIENHNPTDEFAFGNYENESNTHAADILNIVEPDYRLDDDTDSEAEDDVIKATDNLLLTGHVQDGTASLEVWVFNKDEPSFYAHHDFLLPSYPLCIEHLNRDPGSDKPGNMCAIGCVDPVITLWDLDIQDLMEASFKLGSKGSKKSNRDKFGHSDAVLDLSWNRKYEHILASGSVDQTLILWDLDSGVPHTVITAFEEKVQTIEFNPSESQSILAGSAGGIVRLLDCRDPKPIDTSCVKWTITGEVEKVLWHPVHCNYFVVGNNEGDLAFADKRKPAEFLWCNKAHEEEISGICFNSEKTNLLTSTSTDGEVKIWKCDRRELKEVYRHDFKMGRLQCMKQCPEDPFTLAFGGEKPPKCRIFNIKNFEIVREVFDIPAVDN